MNDIRQRPDDFARRYEAASARLFAVIEASCDAEPDWPLAVRAAIASALALLASKPGLGRPLLIEPSRAGPEGEPAPSPAG